MTSHCTQWAAAQGNVHCFVLIKTKTLDLKPIRELQCLQNHCFKSRLSHLIVNNSVNNCLCMKQSFIKMFYNTYQRVLQNERK
ncbi:hypothetical protein XELAEV_18013084mg [Xenopus laevis]|uniref:Uncharacterized protein n=1 Tax=Xenopus laevis TaxID=8355 RepID=A0A974DNW4_XENLA|nr:hypothetical protein XELAEV_18013084mg [Xenopus laevis]